MYSSHQLHAAEQLKAEGNAMFQKQKFQAAIEKYTEAITMKRDWPVLYVNRALCHKKKGEWARVIEDCQVALSMDKELMKAHYLLGLGLREQYQLEQNQLELQKLDLSIQHLTKALEAAREKQDGIKDEIWHELARAKYTKWQQESRQRKQQRSHLYERLQQLLSVERDMRLRQLASSKPRSNALAKLCSGCLSQGGSQEAALMVQAEYEEEWKKWAVLFEDASATDKVTEPPSAYTCRLTMEVFREPVITPSGQSYEKSAFLEHLRKVGGFDPVTRDAVKESDLVVNVGLRAATQQYLDEHPWAWAECI